LEYPERITFRAGYVVALTLLGAWLRLRQLGLPSFWLDEVLGYDIASAAANQPLWRWLTIFDLEHGPLYYAAELGGRFLTDIEASGRLSPALIGIATIPMAWFAARAIRGHPATPYVFTLLLAVSPLHVYYSREARPYALVALISTALLASFLNEGRFAVMAGLMVIGFYATATVAPLIIAAGIAALITRRWRLAGAAAISASLVMACYHPASHAGGAVRWSVARDVLESFSVVALDTSAHHGGAYAFAALAVIGAIDLIRKNRAQGMIAVCFLVVPIGIVITATAATQHFFAIRYVIAALPAFLLLVSVGIATIVAPLRRFAIVVAIVAAGLLAREGWNAAMTEPFNKLDWRAIVAAIARHSHANDPIIADSESSAICIGFYARPASPHLRVFDARGSQKMGEVFAYQNTTSWLAVAGPSEFANWACRFPIVLATENFRLHYSPSGYYLLTDRSMPAEHRALMASFAGGDPILQFGPQDDDLLGEGWSGAEPEEGRYARWAIGKRAFVAIPMPAISDAPLILDIAPAVQKQLVAIYINDNYIQNAALRDGRHRYRVPGRWRAGINVLRLEFDRAVAPAEVDRHSSDHRPLAARVFEIAIGDNIGRDMDHPVRLADVELEPAPLSLADESVCMSDERFLRKMILSLLHRDISDAEVRKFSADLHRGLSRRTVVSRLAKSSEVARLLR